MTLPPSPSYKKTKPTKNLFFVFDRIQHPAVDVDLFKFLQPPERSLILGILRAKALFGAKPILGRKLDRVEDFDDVLADHAPACPNLIGHD
jgi:hypothetical protein